MRAGGQAREALEAVGEEHADMVLDGLICQFCQEYIWHDLQSTGFPRCCSQECEANAARARKERWRQNGPGAGRTCSRHQSNSGKSPGIGRIFCFPRRGDI